MSAATSGDRTAGSADRPRPEPTELRPLFEPLEVRGARFKNRIVGLPLGLSGYVDGVDSPTERMVSMYRRRAAGGAAAVIVEATYVEPYRSSRRGLLGFYDDRQIPAFSVLVDAIHGAGALAILQTTNRWHTDFTYELGDLSGEEIESLMDHFAAGSRRAEAAGFDGVEVHVAHGWPLARFASPLFNRRHDRYGDPTYVPSEVVARSRAAVSDSMLVNARLSITEQPMDGRTGITLETTIEQLCPALEAAGVDVLNLTFGQGPIAPDLRDYRATEIIYIEPGDKLDMLAEVKRTVAVPVLGRSRINDPEMAQRAVADGCVDLLGLGRQLLADQDFPAKVQERRIDEIRRCTYCDWCAGGVGALGRTLHCAVNETAGREIDLGRIAPIRRPKRVLVVGAGPAGAEAALTLSDRGASVVLVDRSERIGGMLALAAALPHLRLVDLGYLVDAQRSELARSNVEVRLGVAFSADLLGEVEPDAVVWACGSRGRGSEAPAARGAVAILDVVDLLSGARVGQRVLIDGEGEGAELAVSLARGGHEVHLVEPAHKLLPLPYDYGVRRVEALGDYLAEESVEVRWRSTVEAIGDRSVTVRSHAGEIDELQVDTVVLGGRRSVAMIDLRGLGVESAYEIGDARRPRGIGEALDEARSVAWSIAG